MTTKHPVTPLEKTYRTLAGERGPKTPRGWDPTRLALDFVESVTQLEEVLTGDGPFHDGIRKLLHQQLTSASATASRTPTSSCRS